ncbi:hypothetical protein JZ751_003608 [Albula glossodonta]|uniref:Uncharacterized protein n=1 Tax=Albula glossodonta TaxID=121402 RepID=A0A8T2NAQ1_9TELE|nr:hypothetical protein JZ751_003608 [Albula glossodonta]
MKDMVDMKLMRRWFSSMPHESCAALASEPQEEGVPALLAVHWVVLGYRTVGVGSGMCQGLRLRSIPYERFKNAGGVGAPDALVHAGI